MGVLRLILLLMEYSTHFMPQNQDVVTGLLASVFGNSVRLESIKCQNSVDLYLSVGKCLHCPGNAATTSDHFVTRTEKGTQL